MTLQEPEESLNNEPVEAGDAVVLEQALASEKEKSEANLAGWQRAHADFVNYKRHIEQGLAESGNLAKSGLILTLLPVLDDLERAFSAVPQDINESSWLDGFRLIERKLRTTLETQGLSPIKALGEPFDPRLHEAAMQGEGADGIVVGELVKGYRFNDRIIRPSKVIVGNGLKSDSPRRQKRRQQSGDRP
ncbi:MAG: nucleotide exchange factor GrpE [Dehalococcoidales bacterium]|jgi:molecular chaperone GrpE